MQIYQVGGAVRDLLLNYPSTEKDWVVIGETPESMIKQGFRAVGKDFPVFLHPKTHEEYALARTERKTAPGYKGFTIHASPEITLEQDLQRRDLTINAMAMDQQGNIIDPFNGRKDLEKRIFRHVSPAFSEDPVRILRLARFSARYAHLGFMLAEETRQLMIEMVEQGETEHLVAERVWAELNKALSETKPSAFFSTLKDCHALKSIFPEIDRLFGIPQPKKYHPEIDTGIHSLLCLDQATKLSSKTSVRFAALVHDLGKAETDKSKWPSHHGHEKLGIPVLHKMCKRLRIPKTFKILAEQVMRYHTHCHRVFELKASTLVDMLYSLCVFNTPHNITDFVLACEADARGRTNLENSLYPQALFLQNAVKAAQNANTADVLSSTLNGPEIGKEIRQLRISAIKKFISSQKNST